MDEMAGFYMPGQSISTVLSAGRLQPILVCEIRRESFQSHGCEPSARTRHVIAKNILGFLYRQCGFKSLGAEPMFPGRTITHDQPHVSGSWVTCRWGKARPPVSWSIRHSAQGVPASA